MTDPPNITILKSDLALTNAANRNYLAGEFDWTGRVGLLNCPLVAVVGADETVLSLRVTT